MIRRLASRVWSRERRHAGAALWLGAILALALLLRLWGIGFGLPHELTYDEIHEILRALKLGVGQYQWSFGKGGLYYILFIEYGFLYVLWWLLGDVSAPSDFAIRFVQDPTVFYLLGRITVALMGVATCWVAYAIGKRVFGERVGLGAALIGATAYYHGFASHIINVDVGMTLAMWASVLAYQAFEDRGKLRWLIASGVLAGVAMAFKLPGGIVLLVLAGALVSSPQSRANPAIAVRNAFIGAASMLIALTVVAPEWIPSLASLSTHFVRDPATAVGAEDGIRHAIDSITIAQEHSAFSYVSIAFLPHNVVLTLCAIAGGILGLRGGDRWTTIWIVMIVAYLLIMSAGERSPHQRYLMPLSPALWLLASCAIFSFSTWLGRRWIAALGLAAVVSVPLAALVYENYMLTGPDTRIVAKDWVENNVPQGAKILVDGMKYRFVMSPPLHPDEESIARLMRHAGAESREIEDRVSSYAPGEPGWGGGTPLAFKLYAEALTAMDRPAYELHSTVYGLQLEDIDFYLENCFDYVITSSDVSKRFASPANRKRFPASAAFYEQVTSTPGVNQVFAATPAPWRMRGPEIRIYRLDSDCE